MHTSEKAVTYPPLGLVDHKIQAGKQIITNTIAQVSQKLSPFFKQSLIKKLTPTANTIIPPTFNASIEFPKKIMPMATAITSKKEKPYCCP